MRGIRLLVRRILIAVAVVFAVFAVWAVYAAFSTPPVGPQGEVISPDETAYITQIINSGVRMINRVRAAEKDGVYRRDAHAKTHACVAATFSVAPEIDSRLRQGVFREPHTYKAWVRFSSGNEALRSDWSPDARGMAIKLLGVDGPKLLEGEEGERTQDFLMINNPTFFIRNVEQYAQ